MFRGQSVLAALMQLAIVLFLSTPLIAQSSRITGELIGTISDNTGAVVPQAAVIATDAATNQQRTAVSDDAGRFTFLGLHDGIYSVRVHRDEFADTVRPTVTVTIGGVANSMSLSNQHRPRRKLRKCGCVDSRTPADLDSNGD